MVCRAEAEALRDGMVKEHGGGAMAARQAAHDVLDKILSALSWNSCHVLIS
jgi:hypothetical protein